MLPFASNITAAFGMVFKVSAIKIKQLLRYNAIFYVFLVIFKWKLKIATRIQKL